MKSRGIAFDRRPSQFVRRAEKTFRLPRMITGLPTDERCLDLSEQDSGQRGEATGAAAQITPVAYDLGHSDRLASSSSWALVARLPAASFSARRRRSSSIFRRLKPMPGWLGGVKFPARSNREYFFAEQGICRKRTGKVPFKRCPRSMARVEHRGRFANR
jgi:hypothetical protein